MSQIGRVDAISTTIEPPESLRDAPLATIREALRQNADALLEIIAQGIYLEFVSAPREVHSIEEAAQLGKIDAANQFRKRFILPHH